MTQLAASGSRYQMCHTLCIERVTKFLCCACPACCLTCGIADKRRKLQDEELGTSSICQKPMVDGHQYYLSSVLTFLLQNISICWSWFLKGIWTPFANRGWFWNFPCLTSTEEIGSNTPCAQGLPRWIFPPSACSSQHPGQSCPN